MSVFLLFWQPVIVLCYVAIFVLLVFIARWQINMMMMMHFGIEKSRVKTCRDVSRLFDSKARHARHDKRDRRDSHDTHVFRGVATAWTGVDMSTSLFPEVVAEIDANPEHKRLNLYTRALLLLRCPPCLKKHGSTRSTRSSQRARHARHVLRVVSCRDVT